MRLTVEERVFILESFFEKFRRKEPVKSAVAKKIQKWKNTKKRCEEHGETCR
jgi:hypothetical protein